MSETLQSEATQIDQLSAQAEAQGAARYRRAFMLRQFATQEWVMANVVAKGKGTQALVGRVFGTVMDFEKKLNTVRGQEKPVESIVLKGVFESTSYVTGEVSRSTSCYLPMAYAEKVGALMGRDETVKAVEIDVDLGVEATGKTIPYEWVVIAFREGEEMETLKRMRNSRRPTIALPSPQGETQLIEGSAKVKGK